jgi:hypothetical protein
MSRFSKLIILSVILLIVISLMGSFIAIKTKEVPTEVIESARNAISEAKHVRAHIFPVSKKYFQMAEAMYDSSMHSWVTENEKFILNRDFDKAFIFADSATQLASIARGKAIRGSAELKKNLKDELAILEKESKFYDPFIKKLPLHDTLLTNNNKGVMLITEAKIAFEGKEYVLCSDILKKSRHLLIPTHLYIEEMLGDYFLQYSQWRKIADRIVDDSRKRKSYAVLIDKFSRECILYYNGKPKFRFVTELGKNWVGDKHHRGDKATPEGLYKVVDKKEGRHTSYHKALLLNYPNDTDRAQFKEEIKNGSIHRSAQIGGHIEIHGNGGKGIDWTEGCIALSDTDMDKLFKYCHSGTPVAIVGSLKPLHDILR